MMNGTRRPTIYKANGQPYRAAEFSRFTSHLPSICRPTENELTSTVLGVLRARSRFIVKNHAHAAGAISLITRRIVGAGMRIQARLKSVAGGFLRDENAALERIYHDFSRSGISPRGEKHQAFWCKALRTRLIDGEVFLLKVAERGREPLARSWQIIKGDQIAEQETNRSAKGNKVSLGVETNPAGRPVAYHIYRDGSTFGGFRQGAGKVERVPADRVIHWYQSDNPDATRGVPLLTPVILKLADLDEFAASTLTTAWSQSLTSAFITTPFPVEMMESRTATADRDTTVTPERWQEEMTAGVKEYLMPGESVEFADPKSPPQQFDAFTVAILRSIACGIGLSYEGLARDWTRTNYSSGRMGMLEDRLMYREFSGAMDETVIDPVWRDFIDQVYFVGRLRDAPVDVVDLYAHRAQHPQPGWVDPLKEQQAWTEAVKNKIASRREACAERGRDFFDVADELAEEGVYLASKGLDVGIEGEPTDDRVLAKVYDREEVAT